MSGYKSAMKTLIMLSVLVALVLAPLAKADVLYSRGGTQRSGKVTGYSVLAFEVADADGAISKLQAASIEKIEFDKDCSAIFATRNRGDLQAAVRLYEGAMFTIVTADGKTEKLPAMMVTHAVFSGGAGSGKKIQKINQAGSRVDIRKHLVPGKVTIVDFYADWCGPCRAIAPFLEGLAGNDPDVYLRKVDIKDWHSPVAQQYAIRSIPRIEVYDRRGNEVPLGGGDRQSAIRTAVAKAKEAK